MAVTTQKQKDAVSKTFKEAEKAALAALKQSEVAEDDGKLAMKNRDGGILMCNLTIQKRAGAPDPLCVTINEEIRWIKRGHKVVVPWYLVLHMNNNIERRLVPGKDELGKNIVNVEDSPSEPISYSLIDPADDNPDWL